MATETCRSAPEAAKQLLHEASSDTPTAVVAPNPFRYWLATVNVAIAAFLLGALAAPALAASGVQPLADWLYAAYHFTCHQWAFRSFFLFGPGAAPIHVYDQAQLASSTPDAFGFVGSPELGWKMAFCERDLAIYVGLLIVGVWYARRRDLRPAGYATYAILILPMALDGFTQLFGWRESTWQLRVFTGLLFGLASAWLVLPRLDEALGIQRATRHDTAGRQLSTREDACDPPRPVAEPWITQSPRG